MYHATVAAAALHQVLLRTMTKALRDDNVVAQNVASGLFCVLFVALGVADRPTLLAATMLGYLVSDSASVTTTGYAVHHVVTATLLLVSLHGEGAYDDLTLVLGGYRFAARAVTVAPNSLLCKCCPYCAAKKHARVWCSALVRSRPMRMISSTGLRMARAY